VQAERWVVEELKRMGWSETDLRARRKGEPRKVELAWELRSQTTMPLAWIAERLNMGSRGHLAWLLQRRGQNRLSAPADQCLLAKQNASHWPCGSCVAHTVASYWSRGRANS
jgi:hypothetical protein